jgi:molybdate/tungstate transport system substrate-binding protein
MVMLRVGVHLAMTAWLSTVCIPYASAEAARELSGTLTIFHAGSLAMPFKEMAAEFRRIHPKVEVLMESAGSRECARKISELGRPCDVFGSADYIVIDQLLIPEHAAWSIKFAANEMAIVYHAASRRAADIDANNWFRILADPKVAFGRADPNCDPCGYRTILTLRLAEVFYGQPGLAETLLKKDTSFIRPKEVDLLALLESRNLDYIFIYRSVGVQHGLKCLLLPDEINLKRLEYADRYRAVSVTLTGKEPGATVLQAGEPVLYGITIPNRASNPEAAAAFVALVLDREVGGRILARNGQPAIVPSVSGDGEAVPAALRGFLSTK